ncbi:MAG: PilT/PilU family type 4a pilus ATPase [Synechococcales bacterium]|nr:PilT/PilU family type 4a pilus ATPase [Synechococcales bacterium]
MTAIQVSTSVAPTPPSELAYLVQDAYNRGATALYLQIGRSPFYRLHGKLMPQDQFAIVTPARFSDYIQEILSPEQIQQYSKTQKLDVTVTIPGVAKARLNCGPTMQGVQSLSLSNIVLDSPLAAIEQQGTIYALVMAAQAAGASDIHLQVGEIPRFRVHGQMIPQERYGNITPRQYEELLDEVLSEEQRHYFQTHLELDTAIFYPGLVRCRINCAQAITGGVMVLRLIALAVPTIAQLHLPSILTRLAEERQGLILVTGSVNTGKSTTLAAMLRHINDTMSRKIVTIEDPVEYVHTSNQSLITQREVGLHTHEFKEALRSALRQDPDVILIGEMRDRETVDTAIRAALTGHLVLGTLHTKGSVNALKRLLNFYTPEEQETVRHQIVEAIRAVISQVLVPTIPGGRSAALEIMLNTEAIQDYLQKGSLEEIYQLMEEGHQGSQTLNQSLFDLYESGMIAAEAAIAAAFNPEDLGYMLKNFTRRSSRSGLQNKDYSGKNPI